MPVSELRKKYGGNTFDAGLRMQQRSFEQRVARYDSLDQHYTKGWLDFAIAGMYRRPALDTRTRRCPVTGFIAAFGCYPAPDR